MFSRRCPAGVSSRCWRRHPPPAQLAAAVDRFLALREFRSRLYACLASRADALFELADAVLCADHAVTSLVQLCLEPEFTRGHGALYDALSAGRIDDEKLFSLLASELPQAVDGPTAREWIAEHDVIDHGLLEQALAGLLPDDASQVRDACARWSRLRFAVDATAYPRPDAWCSPGREHVHNGACHCRGSSRTAPGWEYQFTAAIGHLRTAWAALVDVTRTVPATRTAQTIAQVRNVLRRLRAAGHGAKAAPLFVFDAGYSAAALTDGLAGLPGPRPGPARRRLGVLCRSRHLGGQAWPSRPPRGGGALPGARGLHRGHRARAPGPGEALAPEPRTRRGAHLARYPALRHRPRRGLAPRAPPPPRRSRLVRRPEEPAGPARHPHPRHRRAAARRPRPAPRHVAMARRPGPLSLDELWRAYLARFDIEHAFKVLKGTLGLTAAKVRAPEQADRWVRLLMAAHAQLLLARPLTDGLRLALGETARSRPAAGPGPGPPGISQHPPWPGDTRPCRETLPSRPRQAQRQQQRPSSPLPSPRRSQHATHSKHAADQGKG